METAIRNNVIDITYNSELMPLPYRGRGINSQTLRYGLRTLSFRKSSAHEYA